MRLKAAAWPLTLPVRTWQPVQELAAYRPLSAFLQ